VDGLTSLWALYCMYMPDNYSVRHIHVFLLVPFLGRFPLRRIMVRLV